MEQNSGKKKIYLPSEAALAFAIVLLSFSLILLVKSDIGLTSVALTSYVLSRVFTFAAYGTWTYIVYSFAILALVVALRRIKPGYIISFGLALLTGMIINVFEILLSGLPVSVWHRAVYFAAGFWGLALATCLLNFCRIPTLPYDTFTRDMTEHFNIKFRTFKTAADIVNLALSAALALAFTGRLIGIGPGTILLVFQGSAISLWRDLLSRFFILEPRIAYLSKLSR